MKKKISVIVVTARMGCLDVLVHGMMNQTMPRDDHEVIIVDSCYTKRSEYVYSGALPNNFRYERLPDVAVSYDACFANNFGLRLANGELIIFFSDLNWPEPRFLERHWQIYTNFPGYSMTGYCDRWPVPTLKTNLNWRDCWWSIFADGSFTKLQAEAYFASRRIEYSERKGGAQAGAVPNSPYFELPGRFFYGALNESIPMTVLKELNGWDESYDGGYGSADIDLGTRANLIGWKFLNRPDSVNIKFGTKGTSAHIPGVFKPITKSPEENYAHYEKQMAAIRNGERSTKALIGAW